MKRIKTALCLALILLMSTVLSGCKYNVRLSDMSIVQGLSVDYENKKTSLCVQYLDLSKGTGTTDKLESNITSVKSGVADNINQCVSTTSAGLSKPLFFGQNKVIVFGFDYVKNGIDDIGYILEGVNSRPDVLVAVCEQKGEDMIKSKENNARVPAQSLFEKIRTGEQIGYSVTVSVNDVVNLVESETSDLYLPLFTVSQDNSECSGIAVFSSNDYAASLNETESFGFLLIKNLIDGANITVYDKEFGNVGIEITSSKARNKAYYDNDRVVMQTDLTMKLTLNDAQKTTDSRIGTEDAKRIEKLVNKRAEQMCKSAVEKCFSNKSDPFMLGKMLAKSNYSVYKEKENAWRENLPSVEYQINVKSNVRMTDESYRQG